MKLNSTKDRIPKVLFVCYGNTCRSPMAEGLAKKILGDRAVVKSAGFIPMFDSAQPEAVAVLDELYDVDISQHRPKDLSGLSLSEFDRVIVLDTYVYNTLNKLMKNNSSRLVLWDTEDPFGQDRAAYERVARWLESHLRKHLVPLLFFRRKR
jgi:protein-tyrosine-phosphatase